MADTKITPGAQKARHSVYEFLLGLLVKIDHDISAENKIELSLERIRVLQVEPVKSDDPFDMRSYLKVRFPISIADLLKIGLPKCRRYFLYLIL